MDASPLWGAAWFVIQWMTNRQNEPRLGAKTGGAARLSTWSNPAYTTALKPGYVEAVTTAMKTSRPTGVFTESWKEIGMMVVDAVQAIYGGTPAEKACADLQQKALRVVK